MNIALFGHGRMGKQVEALAPARMMTVTQIFTERDNLSDVAAVRQRLSDVEVCIDFSTPTSVLETIRTVAACGKNIVVGTTGWYDQLDEVKKIVKEKKIGFLYSSNFSIGMNIFLQILTYTAHVFERFDMYDVAVSEMHHHGKADSPSGTALTLGQIILQHIHRKKGMLQETAHGAIRPEQLHVTSTRLGDVVGTHRVTFDAEADAIELVHTAKNRQGFALGALIAAEWLKGKKGFYTMKDIIVPP